jgi:DUF971 family protein
MRGTGTVPAWQILQAGAAVRAGQAARRTEQGAQSRAHREIETKEIKMEPIAAIGTPWPTEVRLRKDKTVLAVAFDNGEAFEFPAEFLRVHSPSAEVQGHSPEERQTVGGKRNIMVIEVHPVGNYAVRLVFDDMHASGIYTWEFFLKTGREQDAMWQAYLDELAAKGMTREPPGRPH